MGLVMRMRPGQRRLALAAADGQIVRECEYSPQEEKMVIHSHQEVDGFVRHNQRVQNESDGRARSDVLNRAAVIPNLIIEKWMRMGINAYDPADTPKVLGLLDDPEWKWLRAEFKGTLSRRPYRHFMRASTASAKALRLKT